MIAYDTVTVCWIKRFISCRNPKIIIIRNQSVLELKSILLCSVVLKMGVFKKLQSVGASNKPYIGFTKLKIGYHSIHRFRLVKNKFASKDDKDAKSILAELENQVVFLPNYFFEILDADDIKELTSGESDEQMYLYFGGRREQNKSVAFILFYITFERGCNFFY